MIHVSRAVIFALAGISLWVAGAGGPGATGHAQTSRRASYDFTGDGISDLLLRNLSYVGIWDYEAGGAYTPRYMGLVDYPWDVVGAGDYNADGTSDILFLHPSTGAIGYWAVVNGALSEFIPLRWSTGAEWHVVSSRKRSDFDGDGRDEILWQSDAGQLGMYVITGDGPEEFEWVVLGTFDPAWKVIGTGDFTADGREDILWRHATAHSVGYFQMNGASIQGWTELPGLDADWHLGTIGDVTGDGFDDIYWLRKSAAQGEVAKFDGYWDMSGGTVNAFRPVTTFGSISFVLRYALGNYLGDASEDLVFNTPTWPAPGPPLPGRLTFVEFVDGTEVSRHQVSDADWKLQ